MNTTYTHTISLPNGAMYAIPDHFLKGVWWTDLAAESEGDPLDFDGVGLKNPELAAALAALALVRFLETKPPIDPTDAMKIPKAISAGISAVTQERKQHCSLEVFASEIVPGALAGQRKALMDTWMESYQLRWLDFVRDWHGADAVGKVPHPLLTDWIEPTVRLELAYRELRKNHGINEVAEAVARGFLIKLVNNQ